MVFRGDLDLVIFKYRKKIMKFFSLSQKWIGFCHLKYNA